MQVARSIIHFTAALVQKPSVRSTQQLDLVLGGRWGPEDGSRVFYQPAMALGPLAGRLGQLGAGEAVTGHGALVKNGDDHLLLIEEVALEHQDRRLEVGTQGGILLLNARLDIEVRGMVLRQATVQTLEDRVTRVANVTLGLKPREAPVGAGLILIELAGYDGLADKLMPLESKRYVAASGQLQRRQLGGKRVSRIELRRLEALHGERALL